MARVRASRRQFSDLAGRIDGADPRRDCAGGLREHWLPPIFECFSVAPFVSGIDCKAVPTPDSPSRTSRPPHRFSSPCSMTTSARCASPRENAGETTPRPICDVYVELEIEREEERREQQSAPAHEREPGTMEALREELEARRKAAWDLPGSEAIPASAMRSRAVSCLGPAGTGRGPRCATSPARLPTKAAFPCISRLQLNYSTTCNATFQRHTHPSPVGYNASSPSCGERPVFLDDLRRGSDGDGALPQAHPTSPRRRRGDCRRFVITRTRRRHHVTRFAIMFLKLLCFNFRMLSSNSSSRLRFRFHHSAAATIPMMVYVLNIS